MLVIRLTRKGRKNQPFFRVVVTDKRNSTKGGRPAEILGYVDPLTKRKSLKKERILYWLKVGAKPSPTVHNLLVSEKIVEGAKISKFKKSKKAAEQVAPVAVQPVPPAKKEAKPAGTEEPKLSETVKPAEAVKQAELAKDEEKPAEVAS